MSDGPVTARQIEAFRRFITRLPHGKDIHLVILKAHLLIEEQVNDIVAARLSNPQVLLGDERFNSAYRIRLAQALFPMDHNPWMWRAVGELNKLRNRVAHNLEPSDREPLMKKVIELVPGASNLGEGEPLQSQFELALWSLYTAVSELVEPVRGVAPQLLVRNDAIK